MLCRGMNGSRRFEGAYCLRNVGSRPLSYIASLSINPHLYSTTEPHIRCHYSGRFGRHINIKNRETKSEEVQWECLFVLISVLVCTDHCACLCWSVCLFVLISVLFCTDQFACLYWSVRLFVLISVLVCTDQLACLYWSVRLFLLISVLVCTDQFACLYWSVCLFVLISSLVCTDQCACLYRSVSLFVLISSYSAGQDISSY
jgi:hypothetical protein